MPENLPFELHLPRVIYRFSILQDIRHKEGLNTTSLVPRLFTLIAGEEEKSFLPMLIITDGLGRRPEHHLLYFALTMYYKHF